MSTFNSKKTALAVGMTVALFAGAVSAATTTTTNSKHAYEVTNLTGANDPTATSGAVVYTLTAGDILVGRTQASGNVNVRVTLTGAEYTGTVPTVVIPASQGTVIGTPVVAGGILSFVIQPEAVTDGFNTGELFRLTAFDVQKAAALTTVGGSVSAAIDVRDSTSGSQLQTAVSGTILTSTVASSTTFAASNTATVDVTTGKKSFVTGGAPVIDANNITLGTITTSSAVSANISAAGSGATFADNGNTGTFQFDAAAGTVAGTDKLQAEVTFEDATGFSNVYLSTAGCSAAAVTAPQVSLAKVGNVYSGSIALTNATGEAFNICGRTNGTSEIKNQSVTARAGIDFNVARDTGLGASATIAKLIYNGTSIDVYHFNPASNATQISYLRITNPSDTTGKVTITGVCDNGTTGTPSSFTLTQGQSLLLNSTDIENGGRGLTPGLGACVNTGGGPANKYRLNVTGEFSKMMVQNFLRNVNSAGVVTGNVNNEK